MKDLLEKFRKFTDLRSAISEMKNLKKYSSTSWPAPAQVQEKEAQREQIKEAVSSSPLQHIGVKHTTNGIMTHMVGMKGADWHYEINMDMHQASQKKPSISVIHVDSRGNKKSQHPKIHTDLNSAVRGLLTHSNYGKWEM